MANIKISDLTAASVAADANEFEINEAGTSKKVTGSQIKAYVNSADGALASKNTVATADIDNLAVTTGKLAADAVDGTKIANDAIGNEHIATGAVNADSIASNAVGADELNVPGNGTAGQYLASDGDGTMTWTTLAAAAGGFSNMQVFTSPGTWTNPGTVEKVKVTVVGGGGGGVYCYNTAGNYGAAAAGAAIEVISFPSGTNVPVTVGSGGNPNNNGSGGQNGGTGGTSSFGAYCSATGGQGAYCANSNPPKNPRNPGNGTGGNANFAGGYAHSVLSHSTGSLMVGGASIYGGGTGAGGRGGHLISSCPGLAGQAGSVIVEY